MKRVSVIDSHTGGEPTRVILSGGPDLGGGTVAEQLARFHADHDCFRSAVINEPRGSEVLVGALLLESADPTCAAGVIFFNNVGPLGMCGHGTIGLVVTLAHMGRLSLGRHRFETPVGVVSAEWHGEGRVSVRNVPSFRQTRAVKIDVPGLGKITGDVAWGGNWFFLVEEHGEKLDPARVAELTAKAARIRMAVNAQGYPEVDHIELVGPPQEPGAHAKNFVLCPGGAYDRSPCGTGTSAKVACLAADGKLREGETWVQEGILGSTFTGSFAWEDATHQRIVPTISGTAHLTAEATLLFEEGDPLRHGIRAAPPAV